VTPSDGTLSGSVVTSAAEVIQDSAPVLSSVSITPSSPKVTDTLTANLGSASDADGDSISSTYQRVDTASRISGATSATLDLNGSGAHKGDNITVKVTPSDGTLSGSLVTSGAVTIQDSAPALSSVSISPSSPKVTDTLTANLGSASDADGDSI